MFANQVGYNVTQWTLTLSPTGAARIGHTTTS